MSLFGQGYTKHLQFVGSFFSVNAKKIVWEDATAKGPACFVLLYVHIRVTACKTGIIICLFACNVNIYISYNNYIFYTNSSFYSLFEQ